MDRRSSLESTYGDPSKVSDADARVFQAMMLREGNRDAGRQIVSYVPDGELVRRIAEIDMPTLVLWDGKDTWTLPKYGHWFDEHLPNSDLKILMTWVTCQWRRIQTQPSPHCANFWSGPVHPSAGRRLRRRSASWPSPKEIERVKGNRTLVALSSAPSR